MHRDGRYPYAFAASEVLSKFGVTLHRSQVRKFAIANRLAMAPCKSRPSAHIRRWQRENVNEPWQLDAMYVREDVRAPVLHPWWELAWATYATTTVDSRGKVRCGQWCFPVRRPHGATVWVAHHVDGTFTVLARPPFAETYPSILWTNNRALNKYECGGFVE